MQAKAKKNAGGDKKTGEHRNALRSGRGIGSLFQIIGNGARQVERLVLIDVDDHRLQPYFFFSFLSQFHDVRVRRDGKLFFLVFHHQRGVIDRKSTRLNSSHLR